MSANQVCDRTAMDKVRVSRALKVLVEGELVTRAEDEQDRRRSVLRVTEVGRDLVAEITPFAMDVERELLDALAPNERRALDDLLDRLMERVGI